MNSRLSSDFPETKFYISANTSPNTSRKSFISLLVITSGGSIFTELVIYFFNLMQGISLYKYFFIEFKHNDKQKEKRFYNGLTIIDPDDRM